MPLGIRPIIFATVIVATTLLAGQVSAQTADELRQSIATKTAQIRAIEQEIETYKNDLSKIASLKITLKNLIASLDLTQKKLESEIRVTGTKVDNTNLKIKQLESDIAYKTDQIGNLRAALSEAVRGINEGDSLSLPEIALSKDSFSGVWGDLATMGFFNDSVEKNVTTLKNVKDELQTKQSEHEQERKDLLGLKSELTDRKKIAEQNKKEKTILLKETNSQESQYTKILNQKLALKQSFERDLEDYESTLKFILDPSSVPPRGTKVFSWPLPAPVTITQKFGKTSASGRLYASGTHNGVDFAAPVGTQVRAVLSGTVVGTGDTDLTCPGASYGRWVLIRHNNGLSTVYGHLSLIKVRAGDTVVTGDVIAYSGNTGYSTGPHLHVSLFAANAVHIESRPSQSCSGRMYTMPVSAFSGYLDPLDYF